MATHVSDHSATVAVKTIDPIMTARSPLTLRDWYTITSNPQPRTQERTSPTTNPTTSEPTNSTISSMSVPSTVTEDSASMIPASTVPGESASPFNLPKLISLDSVRPVASIGIISDLQSCFLPNGHNHHRTEIRYYRHAMVAAERAMKEFLEANELFPPSDNAVEPSSQVQHCIHLGDLLDGLNHRHGTSQKALDEVFARLPRPARARDDLDRKEAKIDEAGPFPSLSMYHLIGNHELYNFPRHVWAEKLFMGELAQKSEQDVAHIEAVKLPFSEAPMFPWQPTQSAEQEHKDEQVIPSFTDDHPLYYDFSLSSLYRFVMLDAFEVATQGRSKDHPQTVQAHEILRKHNLHNNGSFLDPYGPTYHTRRFVEYNGGMSERQLHWLMRVLEDAKQKEQFVILCSHVPFEPRCCSHQHLQIWNQHELMTIIEHSPHVVACFHGHDHRGGHFTDPQTGVHHHIFEALLTTPDDRACHGRLDLYEDTMELRGVDLMRSYSMPISERARQFYAKRRTTPPSSTDSS